MKIYVYYENAQDKLSPLDDMKRLIEDCTRGALNEENMKEDAEVSVTLVDDEDIRALNHEHRGIDRATDVLSFPLGDENGFETNPETGAILLGDIVISLERAAAQAEEYGHSLRRETAFLITHSLFHLLGYDHENDDEEKVMFSKQERVLELLGRTR